MAASNDNADPTKEPLKPTFDDNDINQPSILAGVLKTWPLVKMEGGNFSRASEHGIPPLHIIPAILLPIGSRSHGGAGDGPRPSLLIIVANISPKDLEQNSFERVAAIDVQKTTLRDENAVMQLARTERSSTKLLVATAKMAKRYDRIWHAQMPTGLPRLWRPTTWGPVS